VLLGWKWDDLRAADRLYPLIYGYWILTWALQVPARCLAMAWMISGNFGRNFWVIALGLNLIWFTAPQDALFYFVWLGLYDRIVHYFDYLPPAGFWNLWNMLLLRVPLGVSAGALLVRAGLRDRRDWQTTALIALALVAIAAYAVICVRTFLDS
jgi:TRAP-type mannitol/chloroaromatic compound transport system permease large subunit